jgi:hypothetical protein
MYGHRIRRVAASGYRIFHRMELASTQCKCFIGPHQLITTELPLRRMLPYFLAAKTMEPFRAKRTYLEKAADLPILREKALAQEMHSASAHRQR